MFWIELCDWIFELGFLADFAGLLYGASISIRAMEFADIDAVAPLHSAVGEGRKTA